jgi:hypothetical protein
VIVEQQAETVDAAVNPAFKKLRGDPRFTAVLERVGLPR